MPDHSARRDWARHVRPRLSSLRLSPSRENEIVEELSQHLEDRWRELLAGGASDEEATRLALAEFREGNLLAQYMAPLRQSHTPPPITPGGSAGHVLRNVFQDLRYALRLLRKQPAFTVAAILTLALGIGVNTAIFSVVNAVLLKPLPYPDPSRLFVVHRSRSGGSDRSRLSAENFLDLQRDARSFEALGAFAGNGFTLVDRREPEFVMGQMISAELLEVLDVQPLIGRALRPEENEGGRDQVMLLSHGLWQRRYGSDPGIVGQTITANGKPYTVVGIMPAGFEFPEKRYELWVPFAFRNNAQGLVNRGTHFLQAAGRLRGGASLEQAQAEVTTIARRLEQAYPDSNTGATMSLVSLVDDTVGNVRTALLLVLSAVGFVLLIACANVTNLLLARASTRQREIAVRTTLGASRGRLVMQMLTETLVLYAAGAGAGLALAAWGLDGLIALSPADIPRLDRTELDLTTLIFTIGLTLVSGIVFGLVPVRYSTYRVPAEQLKAAARSSTASRATRRARAALVVAEVALSLMLMVGAALAARSLLQLQRVDTGLHADGVLTFNVVPPETAYPNGDSVRRFHRDVIERLSAQPGAIAVGATSHLPLSGQNVESSITPEGWQPPAPGQGAGAGLRGVSGRFFEAIGARVVAGRAFTDADSATSQQVAMVNEEFVRRYWPGQNAVGKRVKQGRLESEDPWKTVVGVYADLKHLGPQAETRPEVMFSYEQTHEYWVTRFMRGLSVVVRTTSDPMSLLPAARRVVRSVDPSVPLVEPQPMTTLVLGSVAQPRFRSTLLVSFAVLAVLLSIVGIYGVVGFNVAQRTHEISVRMALGAPRGSVVGLLMRQETMPVAIGVVVGLLGAIAMGQAMQGLLFNVDPVDPATFIAMPALLAAIALVACIVPARRALEVEPANALRAEQ
jgi:putative ABC transport system permease protein